MLKRAAPLALAALVAAPSAAQADKFGLGREATQDEIAAWDIDIRPDGQGLPEGSGDVWTGEEVYVEQCASCHGDFGEGIDRWPILAGGWGSLESEDPVKTVGSYWPYLSTVWDYVHRAMPFGQAQSLSDDEVYAVTAYILYLNDLVDDDFTLSKETFAEVEMPNEDGFFMDNREEVEPWMSDSAEACMTDCKDEVEITYRAAVLDVTPADAAAREAAEKAAGEGEQTASAETEAEAEPAAEEGPDPELVAAGERVWNKCRACHKVGEGAANGVGPHLNGVVGREAGSLEDYRYSKAMETAGEDGLVWNDETMTEYLANPRKMIRGTKMTFAGLRDEEDIDAVLAYIEAQQP
ncbi:MAG: c-type cytochrome [Pseudomonadota bacterium]